MSTAQPEVRHLVSLRVRRPGAGATAIGSVRCVGDSAPQVSTRPDLPEIAWAAWWEAAHDGTEMRYMSCNAVLTVGRAPGCDIRIGADPIVDERVPRRWAELSWHRGRVLVANVHDRWGLTLTCIDGTGVGVTAVPPGGVATAPRASFVLDAKVPAGLDDDGEGPVEFLINLSAAPNPVQPRSMEPGKDVVETTPVIALTSTQRTIGAAIIAPLAQGRARRASYDMLVHHTNYAMRTVREAVAAMDVTFVAAGLAFPGDGDALDRVAYVLGRHRLVQ
jgi:hypothetical protein